MTDIHKKISEEAIACDMLERYTGSNIQEFQPYLLKLEPPLLTSN